MQNVQVSRHWGKITTGRFVPAWLTVLLVWLYAKVFGCRLDEAERTRPRDYVSLGDFFTRRLRPGARPISFAGEGVSPADGQVTYSGDFRGGFLQQVKGVHYSVNYFLGLEGSDGTRQGVHAATTTSSLLTCRDGSTALFQWVVYLTPGDYHRFHSPVEWTVEKRR